MPPSERPLASLLATRFRIPSSAVLHPLPVSTLGRVADSGGARRMGTLRDFLHGSPDRQTLRLQMLRMWHLAQGLHAILLSDGESCVWVLGLDVRGIIKVGNQFVWNHVTIVDVMLYKCAALDGQPCVFVLSIVEIIYAAAGVGSDTRPAHKNHNKVQDPTIDARLGAGEWRIFGRPVLEVCSLQRSHGYSPSEAIRVPMGETVGPSIPDYRQRWFREFGSRSVLRDSQHKQLTDLRVHLHEFRVDAKRCLKRLVVTDGTSFLEAICSKKIFVPLSGENDSNGWAPGDVMQLRLCGATVRPALPKILDVQRLGATGAYSYQVPALFNAGEYTRASPSFCALASANSDTLQAILPYMCTSSLAACMLVNTRFFACVMSMPNSLTSPQTALQTQQCLTSLRALMSDRPHTSRRVGRVTRSSQADMQQRQESMRKLLKCHMPSLHRRFVEMQTRAKMDAAVDPTSVLTSMSKTPQHTKPHCSERGVVPYEALALRLRILFAVGHPVWNARGIADASHVTTVAPNEELCIKRVKSLQSVRNYAVFGVLRTTITVFPPKPLLLQKRQARLHNPGIDGHALAVLIKEKNEVFHRVLLPNSLIYVRDAMAPNTELFRDADGPETYGHVPNFSRETEMANVSALSDRLVDHIANFYDVSDRVMANLCRSSYNDMPLTRGVLQFVWDTTQTSCEDAIIFQEQEVARGQISVVTGKLAQTIDLDDHFFHLSPYCYLRPVQDEQTHISCFVMEGGYLRINVQCDTEPILYGKKVFYGISTFDDTDVLTCVDSDPAFVSLVVHDGQNKIWITSRCPSLMQIIYEVLTAEQQDAHYARQADDAVECEHYPSRSCLCTAGTSILRNMVLSVSLRDPCLKALLPPTHIFGDPGHTGEDVEHYTCCVFEVFDCVLLEKNCVDRLGADFMPSFGDRALEAWLANRRYNGDIDVSVDYTRDHAERQDPMNDESRVLAEMIALSTPDSGGEYDSDIF